MVILRLCLIILTIICGNDAVTHWVVTETGRIQAYLDSPFDIRRPYDLLALLDQETRNNDINALYNDLINRKTKIEQKSSSCEGMDKINEMSNCLYADEFLSDTNLSLNFAYNGSDRADVVMDFANTKYEHMNTYDTPDCLKFSTIEGTTNPYDVPLIQNEININLDPDDYLMKFLPVASVNVFGHEIAQALTLNSSSWFHYNLATIFWRIKGDGGKAISCVKRAIQYVPRRYRDIPLHNLAGILHQAEHFKEAAIFLHTAVGYAPNEAMHYFALGNVYIRLEMKNISVTYFDKFLELKPDQKDAILNTHSIFCAMKVEKKLSNFQQSLQGILAELHDYHSQQQQWIRLQERLMWEQASFDVQFDEGFQIDSPDMLLGKRIQKCVQKTSENSKQIISCNFYVQGSDFDTLNLEYLFDYVKSERQKLYEQMGKTLPTIPSISNANVGKIAVKKRSTAQPPVEKKKSTNSKTPPLLYPKFPTTMSTSSNQYFDSTGWPTKDECLSWNLPVDEKDDLDLPVFLPPDNKGYQVKKILSEYINLSEGSQHELPWYPPVCEHHKVFGDKYIPSNERQALNNELKSNMYLRNLLLQYVNDGKADEAEIGQRIITAMEKKSAPRWVLATLASLYWRIRGNARRALDCLDLAFQIVSKEPTEVVLVSIGSVVYQLGFIDQAVKFATLAFKINYVEPSTNFLLALLHYSNNNPLLAMYYMKNVLRVDPEYYDGKAELLLKTWGCRIKLGVYSNVKQSNERSVEGMCAKKESFKGEGVICSPNGDHCKTAAIQCYQTNLGEEDGGAGGVESSVKLSSNPPCGTKHKLGLGHSLISSLLAAEGSGDTEPDQSKLESVTDAPHQAFHMRLSLGEEHSTHKHAGLADFYVSIALSENPDSENLLYVYDKYGTYSLSPTSCKNLKVIHQFKYASVWPSIVSRSLDITSYLKPLPKTFDETLQPHCIETASSPATLDHLTAMILRHRLPSSPEKNLIEMLELMASDHKSTLKEFGVQLNLAISENTTSWILATASAMYWRIVGNTEQAITCLRLALANAPPSMQDIPLIGLANLLNRVGFHADALEVAHLALKTNSNFVLNHFTIGNIYIAMGELERAVAFYRACLAIDSNFEPARHILQVVLCSLLFDDSGSRKAVEDLFVN